MSQSLELTSTYGKCNVSDLDCLGQTWLTPDVRKSFVLDALCRSQIDTFEATMDWLLATA